MSAFAIFAVVLTFAYAIYYAVVIFLDMTRTEGQKSELEDIDIPGMASKVPDEPPTEVLASEQPKSEPAKEQPTPQQPSKGADSGDKPASSSTSGNTAEEVMQKLLNEMHPIPIESEAVFDSDEMLDIIANGGVTSSGQQIEMTQLTL